MLFIEMTMKILVGASLPLYSEFTEKFWVCKLDVSVQIICTSSLTTTQM